MPPPVPIPLWNAEGLISPIDVTNPVSANRAPYFVSLVDLVMRFSTSLERTAILRGFLGYRAELHSLGLNTGFQWLDGSFMESIETSPRNCPPSDVDVVTFYRLPSGMTQGSLVAAKPELFPSNAVERDALKVRFRVDAFTQDLGTASERLVNRSNYWYSVWAHQRTTFRWKGFLQIDLSPVEDSVALPLLTPPASGINP
jgi:hypothetical protein